MLEATPNLKRDKSRSICVSGAWEKKGSRETTCRCVWAYVHAGVYVLEGFLSHLSPGSWALVQGRQDLLSWLMSQSIRVTVMETPMARLSFRPTLPSVIINPYWGRVLRFNHNYLFKQHERKIKSFHKDYRICKAVQQQEKWFSIPVLVQKVHLKLTNFITQKKKQFQ